MKKLMMMMLGLAFLTGTFAIAQEQKDPPKVEKKKKAPKKKAPKKVEEEKK